MRVDPVCGSANKRQQSEDDDDCADDVHDAIHDDYLSCEINEMVRADIYATPDLTLVLSAQ